MRPAARAGGGPPARGRAAGARPGRAGAAALRRAGPTGPARTACPGSSRGASAGPPTPGRRPSAPRTRRSPAPRRRGARWRSPARRRTPPLPCPPWNRARRRSTACACVLQVSTPLPTGVRSSSATRVSPAVTASHTYSKCGVPPRTTTPSATTASWRAGQLLAHHRQLDRAGHPHHGRLLDAGLAGHGQRPLEEDVDDLGVPPRRRHRQAQAGRVGHLQCWTSVAAHDIPRRSPCPPSCAPHGTEPPGNRCPAARPSRPPRPAPPRRRPADPAGRGPCGRAWWSGSAGSPARPAPAAAPGPARAGPSPPARPACRGCW